MTLTKQCCCCAGSQGGKRGPTSEIQLEALAGGCARHASEFPLESAGGKSASLRAGPLA